LNNIVANIEVWCYALLFGITFKNLFRFVFTGSPIFLTNHRLGLAFRLGFGVAICLFRWRYCVGVWLLVWCYVLFTVTVRPHGVHRGEPHGVYRSNGLGCRRNTL